MVVISSMCYVAVCSSMRQYVIVCGSNICNILPSLSLTTGQSSGGTGEGRKGVFACGR